MKNQIESGADNLKGLAESCLKMTDRLLQKYRYRLAGTPECRQAATEIADDFRKSCDSIYRYRDLTILTRDRNFMCRLSDSMISDLCAVAGDHGINLKRGPIPFGGGGTDAAAFAVAGIKVASIIGMPKGIISKGHLYHTSKDTVDNIETDAVRAVLELATSYARKVDNEAREQISR